MARELIRTELVLHLKALLLISSVTRDLYIFGALVVRLSAKEIEGLLLRVEA